MEVSVGFAASACLTRFRRREFRQAERLPITTRHNRSIYTRRSDACAVLHGMLQALLPFYDSLHNMSGSPSMQVPSARPPAAIILRLYQKPSLRLSALSRCNIPGVSFRVWGCPSSVRILRSCSSFIPRNRDMGTCQYQSCFAPGLLEVCGIPRAYRLCLDVKRVTGPVASIGPVPLLP
jgi:hypothetical protein